MSGWRKKQIADLQAGADIHAGDGGYRIGSAEDHAAFVAKRNKSIMHERIRELAIEARLGPALLLHHWGKVDALTDSEQEALEQIEKFAELIVRKCCIIADEAERADVPVVASKFIKAHFGVE